MSGGLPSGAWSFLEQRVAVLAVGGCVSPRLLFCLGLRRSGCVCRRPGGAGCAQAHRGRPPTAPSPPPVPRTLPLVSPGAGISGIVKQAGYEGRPGVTSLKDVSAAEFIKAYAAHLKKGGRLTLPDWVDYVKTAAGRECVICPPRCVCGGGVGSRARRACCARGSVPLRCAGWAAAPPRPSLSLPLLSARAQAAAPGR